MKYVIITLMLLSCGVIFSQSKKEQIQLLQHQLDSISEANKLLVLHQDEAEKLTRRTLSELRTENETLRKIMKGYIIVIDSLSGKNQILEEKNSELEQRSLKPEEKKTGKTNTTRARATTNSTQISNPFGGGGTGSGGQATGAGLGVEQGAGTQYSEERVRLNNVSVQNLQIDEDASIYYKLTVDFQGNVVAFSSIRHKTTTTNLNLINKIGVAIKKQVKYNKIENAPLVYQFYTIHIKAN